MSPVAWKCCAGSPASSSPPVSVTLPWLSELRAGLGAGARADPRGSWCPRALFPSAPLWAEPPAAAGACPLSVSWLCLLCAAHFRSCCLLTTGLLWFRLVSLLRAPLCLFRSVSLMLSMRSAHTHIHPNLL